MSCLNHLLSWTEADSSSSSPHRLYSLSYILEEKGFDAITATNTNEYIEFVRKGFEGIILLDIIIPNIEIKDVFDKIVNEGYINKIKVINLYKPVMVGELVHRINELN